MNGTDVTAVAEIPEVAIEAATEFGLPVTAVDAMVDAMIKAKLSGDLRAFALVFLAAAEPAIRAHIADQVKEAARRQSGLFAGGMHYAVEIARRVGGADDGGGE